MKKINGFEVLRYNDGVEWQGLDWDFQHGLVAGDGKSVMSPALIFAHEMAHAVQYLKIGFDAYVFSTKKDRETYAIMYEATIAGDLGEYKRKEYHDYLQDDPYVRVKSSTDWGTVRPNNSFWTTRRIFTNQNTWTPPKK